MEHRCINCHFLAKKIERQGLDVLETVTRPERKKMQKNQYQLDNVQYFMCHKKVWDEQLDMGVKNREHNLLERDRKGRCFFYQIRPNMSFEIAETLQKQNPKPPPEGYTLLGERTWLLWIVTAAVITAITLHAILTGD